VSGLANVDSAAPKANLLSLPASRLTASTTSSLDGTPQPSPEHNIAQSTMRPAASNSPGASKSILHNDVAIEESLIQIFVRLDAPGLLFGIIPAIPPLIWDIHKSHHLKIPNSFPDLFSAQRCWDFLMDRVLQFYRRTSFNRAYAPAKCQSESRISRQYADYIGQLSAFESAFRPILDSAIDATGVILNPAALIISIYLKTTVITIAPILAQSEMVYDFFLLDFQYIIKTCSRLVASQNDTRIPRNTRFSFEVGIIAPLHVTATKCRDPVVRRQAVELLFESPRQEGMWDSVLTARIGTWIIACEEDGLTAPTLTETHPSLADTSLNCGYGSQEDVDTADGRQESSNDWIVPEKNRVQLIAVEFHIQERHIVVKCQKASPGNVGRRDERETVIAW